MPNQIDELHANFYPRIFQEPTVVNSYIRPKGLNVHHLSQTPKPISDNGFPDLVTPAKRPPPKVIKHKEPPAPVAAPKPVKVTTPTPKRERKQQTTSHSLSLLQHNLSKKLLKPLIPTGPLQENEEFIDFIKFKVEVAKKNELQTQIN